MRNTVAVRAEAIAPQMIPPQVVAPFSLPQPEPVLPDVSFHAVMEVAGDCFGEALASFHQGMSVLWLYLRYWLAALRRDIVTGLAQLVASPPALTAWGAFGWGGFITILIIDLLWR